jgi:hypothetical protein
MLGAILGWITIGGFGWLASLLVQGGGMGALGISWWASSEGSLAVWFLVCWAWGRLWRL